MSVASPLNPPGTLKQDCWKRKSSEEDGEDVCLKSKKARYSWYVTLESESPQPTSSDEDDESIYSVQEHETEYVRDTSDTSTNTWVTSSEEVMHVEYEPASLSGNENPFIDCLTSSDPEISQDIVGYVGAIAAAMCVSDVGLADDSDDSLTSTDSEISHADYWTCVQCNNSNNNPRFRFCEKCYQERKLFLPPRPKGKRRKRPSKKRRTRVRALEGQDLLGSQDSGLGSSLGSQPTLSFDLKRIDLVKSSNSGLDGYSMRAYSQDSVDTGFSSSLSQPTSNLILSSQPGSSREKDSTINREQDERTERRGSDEDGEPKYGSQESRCSMATTLSVNDKDFELSESDGDSVDRTRTRVIASSKKEKSQNNGENKFCIACTVAPVNSVFVHGRTSHICCCYRCAMRVWKTTKHCPMCNRKVTDVLKAYFA